ncbi:MAG: glycosyltransferase [Cyclobacteriaceae bacterium]|nr:glycosyltransferase [Cyclobacteriaceae bacterium]MDH5248139.1 glycosyltransferase [Cyclobacteriaceae bacterium]
MAIQDSNRPFFSIIIPTYNRAKYLPMAVHSLLVQDFRAFEIIVVDDGSTDETHAMIADLARKHPCIKYHFKNNEERSIARNYGILHATGQYIGFLDSDDKVYPNHLQVAHGLLERNDFPEVGHLGFESVSISGKKISISNQFDETYKEKLIHENITHGNAIFIRGDIARKINFIPSPSAILSEDWYLWLRLASRYPFYFDNTVTSSVVHHDARSLLNIDPDKLIASTNTIVRYLKRDKPFTTEYRHKTGYHYANHYTFLTLILALTKSRRLDTVKYLIRAIWYDPTVIIRRRFLASVKHWF